MGAIQSSAPPTCLEGHPMVIVEINEGSYEKGFTCDRCRSRSCEGISLSLCDIYLLYVFNLIFS
jgi:hypothetical protein